MLDATCGTEPLKIVLKVGYSFSDFVEFPNCLDFNYDRGYGVLS